ncbi:hypothetical protein FHS42_000328 [Streptomyces zagrosensis]|uniref:Uncharacterized protein n=1 Tax=Streptomyces zagrosensis TaxID=1042984 RepID=A0A7W9Q4C9_9ACTN|nr:hypothetical protein [Streptomyces zagrosensis]
MVHGDRLPSIADCFVALVARLALHVFRFVPVLSQPAPEFPDKEPGPAHHSSSLSRRSPRASGNALVIAYGLGDDGPVI